MEQYLQKIITEALLKIGVPHDDIPSIKIETPKDSSHGDAATNIAMLLAKALKNNPRNIAADIVKNIETDSAKITDISVAGPGFINFTYAENYLYDELRHIITSGSDYGKSDLYEGERVLVEFVSANPTGPLTVGHGRNAVLGDTVARLLEWTGAKVDREYYFNNAGRQMRKLGLSVRARYLQAIGKDAEMPEDGYEGEYIKNIAQLLIDEHGEALADKDDETIFKEAAESAIFDQ